MATSPFSFPHSSAATYHQPFPFAPPTFPYAAAYPYPPPAPAYASPPNLGSTASTPGFSPTPPYHGHCDQIHHHQFPSAPDLLRAQAPPHPTTTELVPSGVPRPRAPPRLTVPPPSSSPDSPPTLLSRFPSTSSSAPPVLCSPPPPGRTSSATARSPSSLAVRSRRLPAPPSPVPAPIFPTSPSPSGPPSTSIAPPRSAGARAPPAARGPVPIVPAPHLRLEQLPAVVSLPEQAAVPSTSNGAAELGHSSGRSPYPTTSAPHAGSRAPQPVHAPEPPFAPAAYDASVPGTADDRAQVKEAIHHRLQRELLSIKARMDQQQEFERNSFATIRGEISRLSEVAVRLASSLGRANNPSIQFKPEQFSVPAVPAYVAPQVFGEMPAQNSLQETHGTASEHQNPIRNPCVSNLSEQNPDGRPQCYGLQNLCRQSIFLSDGTEHSYFTLPTDYPLERAVSEPVFDVYADETEDCSNVFVDVLADSFGQSNAFVDVLARNSVQQPYEVEQRQSHQAPKCFSNPNFSPERPIVGTIGVFSLTNEQSTGELEKLNDSENLLFAKQDIEQFLNCSCTAPLCSTYEEECQGDENILWMKSACQTSTGNSISFYPWDPGASTPPYSSKFGALVQRLRDPSRNVLLVVPERRKKWDPSIRKTIMDIPHDVKWYFLIQVSSHLSMLCDPGASLPPLSINTQQPAQASRPTIHASTLIGNFEKLHGHEYVALLADSNVTGFSKYTCLSFWIQNNIVLLWKSEIAWPNQSVGTGASSVWDPGIWSLMDMLLGNAAVPNLVPSGLHIHKIQLADSAAIHACNLGFALLPHTQITASGSSNLEVHELASPYVGFHLHPSTKWTSTSPNGFQKNYNAKSLISPQKYLQLSKMDIIFSTFLPP